MLSNAVDNSNPDAAPLADWTPEQQIAHMLELCEAQMESALSESDLAVDALIKAFSALVDSAQSVSKLSQNLSPEQRQEMAGAHKIAKAINEQLDVITKQMASAIVAFQFYDKLTQRLGHVRYSLSTLALFVCDRAQTSQRDQWRRLFTTLRRLYRTEEERQIFTMMVEGASAEEARDHIHQTTQSLRVAASSDIELF
jgi:hypothetical protein